MDLETEGWRGPVRSAYGSPLVWLHERAADHEPVLDTVRRSAMSSLQAERNAEALEAELDALRGR